LIYQFVFRFHELIFLSIGNNIAHFLKKELVFCKRLHYTDGANDISIGGTKFDYANYFT